MRFLIMFVNVCKAIFKGIRKEVKRLSEISHVNGLKKQKNEELILEYQRFGEYMYFVKDRDDMHIVQIEEVIKQLLIEMEEYDVRLAQLRDG